MLDVLREIQLPILCLVLLLGAFAKLADPAVRGPANLLPARLERPATLVHGGFEAVVGAALLVLVGTPGDVARLAAVLLFAGAVATLFELRRRDPEMGCGCFGGLSTAPVGWRTITRAALFAAAAAATVGLDTSGIAVLGGFTVWHGAALAAELLLLGLLCPELKEIVLRLYYRDPCDVRKVPMHRTLSRLRLSDVWHLNSALVAGREPVDVWRQGCWRFLRYPGRRNGRPVDVVFGVPIDRRNPAVRAAVTDAETGVRVALLGEIAVEAASPRVSSGSGPGGSGISTVRVRPTEPV